MDFQTYIPLALSTARKFDFQRANAQHASLGLISELGEFASEVKRIFAYDKPMTEEMRLHMIEEGGDVLWYVPLGLLSLGMYTLPQTGDFELERVAENLPDLCTQMAIFVGAFSTYAFGFDDEDDRAMAADSLSMIAQCMDAAAVILGTTGDHMREQNIAKLRARYPGKFDAAAAEARADKAGASHLVS